MSLPTNMTLNRDYEANYQSDVEQMVCHVGAAAPTVEYVGRLWFDTENSVLKICTAYDETATWTACKA